MTKKKKLIVLIVTLILVVIGIVAYIIYANYETKSKMIEHQDYTKVDKDYWKSAENIIKDEYVNKVASNITVKDATAPFPIINYVAPSKIDGKMLDTLKPEDVFIEYCKMYSPYNLASEENDDIVISINEDKFIELKEITNTKKGKINYEENNNEITFKSAGDGLYIVELLVNKKDIFYLVF